MQPLSEYCRYHLCKTYLDKSITQTLVWLQTRFNHPFYKNTFIFSKQMLLAILPPFNRYIVLNRVTAPFSTTSLLHFTLVGKGVPPKPFPHQAEVNPVLFHRCSQPEQASLLR